ncbi:exodeoxyribonuclease VII small subunit [Pseudothermotoga sp.]|nr:exodeoxyribonuclease VII small subunit [Pseudothermotoga sp.]MCX7812634.1 exodeoxyribonuclease VII small subunit [Pseudothermotoga sp.]MDW8138914.1 exodeoxyribonuclease VII small subunit [Pseudothermotoga sp.]
MKIEELMNELERIVELLNSQNLTLDESLNMYKRGVEIYRKLQEALKSIKVEIEDLYAQLQHDGVENDGDNRPTEGRND